MAWQGNNGQKGADVVGKATWWTVQGQRIATIARTQEAGDGMPTSHGTTTSRNCKIILLPWFLFSAELSAIIKI